VLKAVSSLQLVTPAEVPLPSDRVRCDWVAPAWGHTAEHGLHLMCGTAVVSVWLIKLGISLPHPGSSPPTHPWRMVLSRASRRPGPKPPELPKSCHEVSCISPAAVGQIVDPRTPNQVHSSRADPCGEGAVVVCFVDSRFTHSPSLM
jgi:hypothetical protein